VLTVHRSKGLEFPIVYLPFLWEPGYIPDDEPISFHDPDAGNARVLDVALEGPDFKHHREQYVIEQRGEDLRLAYVALTRARHQAIVWWAGSWSSRDSPLGRLLFARDDDGSVTSSARSTPDDATALKRFEAVAAQAPGCVAVEQSVLGMPAAWSPSLEELSVLAAARFDRSLDRRWRRTSYSDITAGSYEAVVASEPDDAGLDDEADAGAAVSPWVGQNGSADPVPLAQMNMGAEVGTLVHGVLAASEFDAPDLSAELERQIAAAQGRRAVDLGDVAAVAYGLQAVVETPLGPVVGGALRDVPRADRLDELEFELPLAGGDRPDGWLTLSLIADVVREHLPADDPLAGYADRLADPVLRQNVRGYLTGSLDLVVRVGGPDAPRFAVVDYKTNWLGAPGEQLGLHHYRPESLVGEMYRHHYALQALLYTVALHRYLRWRVAGYRVERDLTGVLYLFLRGMVGPETPVIDGARCGVFAWRPPASAVEALSDALDRGAGA
jgi:exodeoxyribonuclease V beta subunit